MKGHATAEGTKAFQERFKGRLAEGHFRNQSNLWFSSIGIGSYLGEPDEPTDRFYEEALKEAVLSGVNVIDSAINYRSQRSERSFGNALAELFSAGKLKREEVIVCTKGGFIPFDGNYPANSRGYLKQTYIDSGILKPEDISQGCHAMTPQYLEDQLSRSLKNLGLETIDIYYLHNPETQLADVTRSEFQARIRKAFEWLEKKVSEGKIQMYGTATWNGYRGPLESPEHLSLEELACVAREAGGAGHHFKAVQLPFNLAMPEAWLSPTQPFAANRVSFLEAAQRMNFVVIASASLLQAQLTGQLPKYFDKYFQTLPHSSQRAIQFVRSVPGITTALIGMKQVKHVQENLETAKTPPLSEADLIDLFQQAK